MEECPQQLYELNIQAWNPARITIATSTGFQVNVQAPPGDIEIRRLFEFQRRFLVKDLGIHARLLLGKEGYTPTWQTTRIRHHGNYLPMHQPVATLCPSAECYHEAMYYCTFCRGELRNRHGAVGPFEWCWFCLDSPTWHHGACCPHNPMAVEWNGMPHRLIHQANYRSFLRTLPW